MLTECLKISNVVGVELPLLSVNDAAQRAARIITSKGLIVNVDINSKTYDIQRTIDETYEKGWNRESFFMKKYPNGITSSNRYSVYQLIF